MQQLKANPWTPRYTLNYKGLAYKTVWVEYPDIKEVSLKLGASATGTNPLDGSPFYTLPMIHDPKTGAVVSDSFKIAEYLDATYPDTPRVIPDGTRGLQLAFDDAAFSILMPLFQFTAPLTSSKLNQRSAEYFSRTRAIMFGKSMEELYPGEDRREEEWKKVESGLEKIAKWYSQGSTFISGKSDAPIFADFRVAALLLWVRRLFGRDSTEWKNLASWHGGRWGNLVGSLEKYEHI